MIQGHGSIEEQVWILFEGIKTKETQRNVAGEELALNLVECKISHTHTSECELQK